MPKQEVRADLLLGRDTLSPGLLKAGQAASNASGNIKQLTRDLYEVSRQRATPVVDLDDKAAETKLTEVAAKLRDLSTRTASANIDVNDKAAVAELAAVQVKLDRLGATVSSPRITLDGVTRAAAQLAAIDVALDKVDGKTATAEVKVDVDRRGAFGRLLGGLTSGAGGGVSGLGAAIPGLGGLLSNPVSAIATVVAALTALPFAAAAAAGGIVTALGGGLAAVGVIAAARTKQVKAAFADLRTDAGKQLAGIGQPFEKALLGIIGTTDRLLPKIIAPFKDALKSIGPSFESFGKTLVTSFASPAVGGAIRELGKAFGAVLDALRPELPVIVSKIAGGIRGIASAIHDHPQLFADFVNFILQTAGALLAMIGGLTRAAANIVVFVKLLVHWTSVGAKYVRDSWIATGHLIEHIWDMLVRDAQATWNLIWRNTVSRVANGVRDVIRWFRNLFSTAAAAAATFRSNIGNTWDTIWRNTVTRVQHGIATVVSWFRDMPWRAIGALFGLGHQLYAKARGALGDMWSGFKSIAGGILRWFGGFVSKIVGFFSRLLHHSPTGDFYHMGRNMMEGLAMGIKDHAKLVSGAMGGVSGAIGGDARANMDLARRIFPWGAAQWPAFVALEMSEAGFNRFARNPSSGAYGIPQALPPSKLPFAGQAAGGSHAGPQLSWMFSYIAQRYSNPANAWAWHQAHNWYASGTPSAAPGWAWVGEHGPELVNFRGGEQVYPAQARAGGGGTPGLVVLEIRSGGTRTDDMLVEIIRNAVRVRGGGDVQAALGKRH